jgi:hypothetical protein
MGATWAYLSTGLPARLLLQCHHQLLLILAASESGIGTYEELLGRQRGRVQVQASGSKHLNMLSVARTCCPDPMHKLFG